MEETTYCAIAAPIILIFKTNDRLISQAHSGLSEQEMWLRPTDRNNPMFWLLGHVVQARSGVLRVLGEPFDTTWGDRFTRGAPLRGPAAYPPLAEITSVLDQINQRLYAKFESLDELQLAQPVKGLIPQAKTLADQLAFLGFHESYHVGQMAYIRKALGHSALVG